MDDLVRIGDKLVSRRRLAEAVDRILRLRASGLSQQEVAERLGLDRAFISRLEALGEVRKGGRVAVVASPIANKEELEEVCRQEGVDLALIWTDAERRAFVERRSGGELLHAIMELVARVRECDQIVLLGSDYRTRVLEALIGRPCVAVEIGRSPITRDVPVDPEALRALLRRLRGLDAAPAAGSGAAGAAAGAGTAAGGGPA